MAPVLSSTTASRRASFCVTEKHTPSRRVVLRQASSPAVALVQDEADRTSATNPRLIEDAVCSIENRKARKAYGNRLDHFDAYLVSAEGVSMLDAKKTHIQKFRAGRRAWPSSARPRAPGSAGWVHVPTRAKRAERNPPWWRGRSARSRSRTVAGHDGRDLRLRLFVLGPRRHGPPAPRLSGRFPSLPAAAGTGTVG